MKPSEIIMLAAQQSGINPAAALKATSMKIRSEGLKPIRDKESLMLFKPLTQGVAKVYFISADSHLNMLSAFQTFKKFLKKHAIHHVFMANQNNLILSALDHSGIHPMPSNVPAYPIVARVE